MTTMEEISWSSKPVRKWYHWYSPDDTPEERRLLLKLDLIMLPTAFLSFWIKNMDYSNISKSIPDNIYRYVVGTNWK